MEALGRSARAWIGEHGSRELADLGALAYASAADWRRSRELLANLIYFGITRSQSAYRGGSGPPANDPGS